MNSGEEKGKRMCETGAMYCRARGNELFGQISDRAGDNDVKTGGL